MGVLVLDQRQYYARRHPHRLAGVCRHVDDGGALTFDIGLHPTGSRRQPKPAVVRSREVRHGQRPRNAASKSSFHCPGWSGTGRPGFGITPELAMQELAWSETVVDGPASSPPCCGSRRSGWVSIATLRSSRSHARRRRAASPTENRRRQRPRAARAGAALDGDYTTEARLPLQFDLVFDRPVQARSVFVRMARPSQDYHAQLSAWDDGKGAFVGVAKFESHISGPFSPHVGSATFPAVKRVSSGWRSARFNRQPGVY